MTHWRFQFLTITFTLLFVGIFMRLFQVMLLQHRHYNVLAQRQHVVQKDLTANRGEIYSADGYPLVMNADVFLLFSVPAEIKNVEETINKLTDIIIDQTSKVDLVVEKKKNDKEQDKKNEKIELSFPINFYTLKLDTNNINPDEWKEEVSKALKESLIKLMEDKNNQYVQLIDQLTDAEKSLFANLNIEGLYFERRAKRIYPEHDLASAVLGFVGKDETGSDRGYFGLEGYYDADLSGREGYELLEKDVTGKRIPYGSTKIRAASPGRDLVLTIQRELQYMLEKKLKKGVDKYRAINGSAILLDPYSGAILAMANAPNYLPEYWINELRGENDVSKIDVFKNSAISTNYEPGSVMKPVTMAMAINESLVTPETIYHDSGPVEYSGYEVKTWNNKYHGDITMTQVLELSNNTGAAWVGHKVGFEKFDSYTSALHFGEKTGVDLQGEEAGIVRASEDWRDIDLANMAFGQGISVTPLQMASVFSALVNGGYLYQPYIVGQIVDKRFEEKITIPKQPKMVGRIFQEQTTEKVRYMLKKVVADGEFKWFVKDSGMDKFSIGGKTGTAQIPFNGRYDPNKTNTTFIGFAPVESPKFVLLVRLNQPSSSTFSAETAVPLWMEIAKDLMIYYHIAPN